MCMSKKGTDEFSKTLNRDSGFNQTNGWKWSELTVPLKSFLLQIAVEMLQATTYLQLITISHMLLRSHSHQVCSLWLSTEKQQSSLEAVHEGDTSSSRLVFRRVCVQNEMDQPSKSHLQRQSNTLLGCYTLPRPHFSQPLPPGWEGNLSPTRPAASSGLRSPLPW